LQGHDVLAACDEGHQDECEPSCESARKPIGVFVLDDLMIVRTGVRDMLEAKPDIWVIGEAGSTPGAVAKIPAPRPDVAVPGVGLPDDDAVLHAGGNKGPKLHSGESQ
jgi:hypothetical protein